MMLLDWVKRAVASFGFGFLGWLSNANVTPNQITCMGLVLVLANCGFYLLTRDAFWLGIGLSLSFAFDSLDGVIARRQGTQSRFGAYLDATVDRYQEIAAYAAIGWVTQYWLPMFLILSGSLLTSYNKARAAMEINVGNKEWPDLLERAPRLWLLCGGLILDGAIPVPAVLGGSLLYLMLVLLAFLTNFTALQRFFRAQRLLTAPDR